MRYRQSFERGLLATRVLRPWARCRPAAGGGASRAHRRHAGARRGGQEGGQGRLLHRGRRRGRREGRGELPSEISRHRNPGRALGLRAPVPAHRPGIRQQHRQRRRRQHLRCRPLPVVEAPGLACPLRAGGRGEALRRERRPGRALRDLARDALAHRLQHQIREARRRPEELRRSPRAEMARPHRQGASGLQRHDPDRDGADLARARLGLSRQARQAADHAGAVVDRAAEEARHRRAADHGRRQRVQPVHAQGERQPDRDRLSERGHAVHRLALGRPGESPASERGAAPAELPVHARDAAAPDRRRRPALAPPGDEGAGRPHALTEIKLFKDDAAAVVDKVEEIKANYAKAFGT